MLSKTGSYSIRAVARLTGLAAHTLRLWEERYGALEVARSPGGHRVYSADNVARLARLKRLVDQGHRISALASLPDPELDERLASAAQPPAPPEEPARAAVFVESLPAAIRAAGLESRVQVSDRDWVRFQRACVASQPDALLLELPEVDAAIVRDVIALRSECPQAHVAAVFHFARRADLDSLHDAGVHTLQAPVAATDVWWLVRQAPQPVAPAPGASPAPALIDPGKAPAPRQFTAGQLMRLAEQSSAVACECPAHLAQLVQGLNAFEAYSASCENSSPEDAALHALLHRETARARAIMENALARVAEAEGLES
ncbi:MAG: MerR family transcriptional regulator [Chromatiales bacterium]|nr:MAG: MerR family transcriptional regulator [Chromatiales bacterium]